MSVPINYLRQVADQLADANICVPEWLAKQGLREADLANATVTLSVEQFGALAADAVALSGVPGFGLLAGRRLTPSTHGVVGLAAGASGSIKEAMEISVRYLGLRTPLVAMDTRVTRTHLEVRIEPALGLGAAAPAIAEMAVLAMKNIADDKTLQQSACSAVQFAFAEPPHAQLARDILGCEVRYAQPWTALKFPLPVAERAASRHDALVLAEALRICGAELKNLQLNTTVRAKLERLMLERKPAFPPLEACARLLGMTPRTLHRRLMDEGTSYSEVLDSVRHRIARECLKVERLSVKEVAYLLGYNDVSNFRRAFKRWEGEANLTH